MRYRYAHTVFLSAILFAFLSARVLDGQDAILADADRAVIKNAYQLWQTHGEEIWPGWTAIPMPMVYISGDHEFAIGFQQPPEGFVKYEWNVRGLPTWVRERELNPQLAASYPFQGTPAVVIGTPEATKSNPTRWSLTAVHEMFHVLQMHRGSITKVNSLKIVEDDRDGSWQLNYPFPYENTDVMRLFHLLGYPLYLAASQSESASDIRYNIGVALDATRVLQSVLRNETGDERAFHYAGFQQWQEGIARYTEYRMAEIAAGQDYQPAEAVVRLKDYESYRDVWKNHYTTQVFLAKHAGRVARSRLEFYNLGLAAGLALDRSGMEWRDAYFAPDIWLDDLLARAAGSSRTNTAVAAGEPAPGIDLPSLDGTAFRLTESRDRLVLVDFWQPWCPPCIQALPELRSLQEKYRETLILVGIVDRCQDRQSVRDACHKAGVDWPTLDDSQGDVARRFGIEGYPHLFLIDRQGQVAWQHRGLLDDKTRSALEEILDRELQK